MDGSSANCNLGGVYPDPRPHQNTLKEAKDYCARHPDCRGITRDNGGYEPRKGPTVYHHPAAKELWLCTSIYQT